MIQGNMHPKWIAVGLFWIALILAVALPSPRAGDVVWLSMILLLAVWSSLILAIRVIRNRRDARVLEKAFFSGRGYPLWLLRFIANDYDLGRSLPSGASRRSEIDPNR